MDVAKAGDQLDTLIDKRARERSVVNELQAMYEAGARRHRERIREGNRWEWVRFFDRLAANHARISRGYEAKAEALLEEGGDKWGG